MPRIAVVFLVDARGHVLLQHRDEHAPRAADQWGMVGGHVEPGEDYDTAIQRELLEETGIGTVSVSFSGSARPGGPPREPREPGQPGETEEAGAVVLWRAEEFAYSDGHRSSYRVYAGRVDLTDDDIVLGEGRAIVFVDPAATEALDKAESCAYFLPLFLGSELYRSLRS